MRFSVLAEFFCGFAVLDDFFFGFAVSNTPQCPPLLTDVGALHNTTNWIAFEKSSAIFKDSPIKRSLKGNLVDGETLKDLAEILLKQIKRNEWASFGHAYSAWERDICRSSYEKHVKPMLVLSSDEIVKFMMKTMKKFKEKCILDS